MWLSAKLFNDDVIAGRREDGSLSRHVSAEN